MRKKYIVRLSDEERKTLLGVAEKLKGSPQKVKRANIMLKADVDSSNWTDKKISEAFSCRTKTVENVRKLLVTEGFDRALNGKQRQDPPRAEKLDGKQQAKVIAMRLGPAPKGFANWSLRLLADKIVELEIVDSIDHKTVGKILKKMG